MHDEPLHNTCRHGSRPIDERCDICWREENGDDDFAMLTPPTRPGPAKASAAPEQDPTERQLDREREAARFIVTDLQCVDSDGTKAKVSVEALGGGTFRLQIRDGATLDRFMAGMGVDVKHGSGKVKV